MDYYGVENLLSPGRTRFSLYSSRVSADLKACGYVVGKQISRSPRQEQGAGAAQNF